MTYAHKKNPEPVVLLTVDELSAIEYNRNVMGGLMSIIISPENKAPFVQAWDDSERLQAQVAALQSELGPLRDQIDTLRGMVDDLLEELHG